MFNHLKSLQSSVSTRSIMSLFDADPQRAATFSARFGDMLFDYSKTNIDQDAKSALLELAARCGSASNKDIIDQLHWTRSLYMR